MNDAVPRRPSRRNGLTIFLIVTILLIVGGFFYYRFEARHIRQQGFEGISAIGELKAKQLNDWWQQALRDATRLASYPIVARGQATGWVDGPDTAFGGNLRRRLQAELAEEFDDVVFVDHTGRILASAREESDPIPPAVVDAIHDAIEAGVARPVNPYRCSRGIVHVDVVVPVATDTEGPPLLVVLRSEAETFLEPVVGRWPTPSPTAESLLVVSDQDDAVVLDIGRARRDTEAKRRVPLSAVDSIEVQAVRGRVGTIEGRDFRGEHVLADIRTLHIGTWTLVTKIDAAEVLAEARYRAVATTLVVLLGILLAGAATGYAHRRRQVEVVSGLLDGERRARTALRESEERLRLALQAAKQGLYDLNVQTGDAVVSPEYATMLGYDPATFVETNANWRDRLHPDDVATVYRAYEDYVAGRAPAYLVEFRQRTRDGKWKWILSLGSIVERDADGRPLRMLGTHTDITERKAAELLLAEHAARLEAAETRAGLGSWTFDVATGRGWWSTQMFIMLGFDPAAAIPTPDAFLERVHPDDRHALADVLGRMAVGQLPPAVEYRSNPAHGPMRWLSATAYADVDPDGRPVRFGGTVLDVTARRHAEHALRESEQQLRLFIEHAPAAIAMFDREMRYLACSRRYAADFRLREADLIGRSHYDVFPEMTAEHMVIHRRCLAGAVEHADEERLARADGSVDWVRWELRPWFDASGQVGGLVFFSEVITERKFAEEARGRLEEQLRQAQRMEAVGRLAGGVAHDFNNMLQTILGYADFVVEGLGEDHPLRDDMNEIKAAASRSADLTRQLLAFARKQTIAPKVLDLNEAVQHLLKMLGRLIGENIELVWKPAPEVWPVSVDPGQVDQILANLVVNARDAIKGAGHITIETSTAEFDERYCREHAGFQPGHYVMLAVGDDGIGMDEGTRAHIFEPFFTTKGVGHGTGLGLATVYGIVKQHRGFIDVTSQPGRGSTFRVFFPRHDAEVDATDLVVDSAPVPTGTETVVVAEDEVALLRLATRLLEQLGYTVIPAKTVTEAVDLVDRHDGPIHLLITDVVMPEGSGRDLWQRVVARRPTIKCLYMSGYTADVIAHRGVLDPGVHFLPKPFTRQVLALKVREVLDEA